MSITCSFSAFTNGLDAFIGTLIMIYLCNIYFARKHLFILLKKKYVVSHRRVYIVKRDDSKVRLRLSKIERVRQNRAKYN